MLSEARGWLRPVLVQVDAYSVVCEGTGARRGFGSFARGGGGGGEASGGADGVRVGAPPPHTHSPVRK